MRAESRLLALESSPFCQLTQRLLSQATLRSKAAKPVAVNQANRFPTAPNVKDVFFSLRQIVSLVFVRVLVPLPEVLDRKQVVGKELSLLPLPLRTGRFHCVRFPSDYTLSLSRDFSTFCLPGPTRSGVYPLLLPHSSSPSFSPLLIGLPVLQVLYRIPFLQQNCPTSTTRY